MQPIKRVMVTGGAGYVGAVLVPKLLDEGYLVRVLDLYMYGDSVLDSVKDHPNLEQVKGDIRDKVILERALAGCDAVIHLACISNDPSFELNPELGKSINYDSFPDLVDIAKESGAHRFIFASSSSVYGLRDEENVTEDLKLLPLTDYSKYKAMCEDILQKKQEPGFTTLILRPATVCGYSPRLRLDLTVNILTNHAVNRNQITVFGGQQKRPNIHIDDVTDLYVKSLQWSDESINGKVFNAGYENHSVNEIAQIVRAGVGGNVEVKVEASDDLRSYHISSDKIRRDLGYEPSRGLDQAVLDLTAAFRSGAVPNSLTDERYYNIKTMQSLNLK
jgi:nucleoside-diphosphate-sugar epimerase